MKALKLAGAVIAAVIVVIALLLVIGIPSGFLKAQIQERVERETGYKLAINGGAADHRACHHPPGGEFAAAARARQ